MNIYDNIAYFHGKDAANRIQENLLYFVSELVQIKKEARLGNVLFWHGADDTLRANKDIREWELEKIASDLLKQMGDNGLLETVGELQ